VVNTVGHSDRILMLEEPILSSVTVNGQTTSFTYDLENPLTGID